MIKNNKGMTLTEIIIAIALISIVLLFMFSLLVTVNDINEESEVNSTYLINKSLILKNIESDLSKVSNITLSSCDVRAIYSLYDENNLEDKYKANECLMINYNDETENAKLGVYYYDKSKSYVISYIHGNVKATRLLPDFEKFNVDQDEGVFKTKMNINFGNTCSSGSTLENCTAGLSEANFLTITIPIIGPDEKDYSIIISYYGTVTVE